MQIKIPFWGENLSVSVPYQNVGEIIFPNTVEIRQEKEIILNALKNPINFPSFSEFIKGTDPVLFIVNDATRPTPTSKILDLLWEYIKNKNIRFLVATGMHRAPAEDEYIEIFGDHYYEVQDRVFSHNSREEKENINVGKTRYGTDIYFDRLIEEVEKIVTITSVEPHYFAGYTGGAKSFLPGVAGYNTIEQNHKLALEATAKALRTEGNPVREEIEEAYDLIAEKKKIFSVQTVLNKDHNVYYCACGETHRSFEAACKRAKDVFSVEIRDKADIVVAVAPYPMDIDFYQSQKAIDNGKLALNENGIIILVASCRKGIGGESFVKLLSSARNPDDALQKISSGYKLGYHKSAKMAEIMKWASIWAYTKLSPDLLDSIFIRGFADLQKAIDTAIEEKGDEKVLFLMDASLTVPRVATRLLHKHRFIYGPTMKKKTVKYKNLDDLFAY